MRFRYSYRRRASPRLYWYGTALENQHRGPRAGTISGLGTTRVETADQYDIGTGTAAGAVPVRPRTDTGLEQHGLGRRTGTNPDQYDSRLVRPWVTDQYDVGTSTCPTHRLVRYSDQYGWGPRTSTLLDQYDSILVQPWIADQYDAWTSTDRGPVPVRH
ncbi:hypothetical protein F5Y08DRAFT_235662 [Xylaria arbuscula]|nr:hypothetical protein F5Y08DRAFT_235662 [Xylaria arbuscula]